MLCTFLTCVRTHLTPLVCLRHWLRHVEFNMLLRHMLLVWTRLKLAIRQQGIHYVLVLFETHLSLFSLHVLSLWNELPTELREPRTSDTVSFAFTSYHTWQFIIFTFTVSPLSSSFTFSCLHAVASLGGTDRPG